MPTPIALAPPVVTLPANPPTRQPTAYPPAYPTPRLPDCRRIAGRRPPGLAITHPLTCQPARLSTPRLHHPQAGGSPHFQHGPMLTTP